MRKFFNLIFIISFLSISSVLPVKAQTNTCAQLKVTTSPTDYGSVGKIAFTRQTIQTPISGAPSAGYCFFAEQCERDQQSSGNFFRARFRRILLSSL
jgi:hypothetical protein